MPLSLNAFAGAVAAALLALLVALPAPAQAARGDRTLDLYYTHTKERKQFTFRKRGRYDQKVLRELNVFLRDWRRNEPTKMDPALFDLLWEVVQEVKHKGPVHVVSAYRSPKTNDMLRSRSRGVAKNSQHTKGRAVDFYLPGMHMKKVRNSGLRKHVGGVGYYPSSNTPFVHLDTGSVRHWPRMNRTELAQVFPRGNTVHVPTDGKPFGGYQVAMASIEKRQRTAARFKPGRDDEEEAESGGGLLALFGFGRKKNEPAAAPSRPARGSIARQASAPVRVASAAGAAAVRTVSLPPVPSARPITLATLAAASAAPLNVPLAEATAALPTVAVLPPTPRARPRSFIPDAAIAVAALGGATGLPEPIPAEAAVEPAPAELVRLAALPRARPAGIRGPSNGLLQTVALNAAPLDAPLSAKIDERLGASDDANKIDARLPQAATAFAPEPASPNPELDRLIDGPSPKIADRLPGTQRVKPRFQKGPAYAALLSPNVSVSGRDVAWFAAPSATATALAPMDAGATGLRPSLAVLSTDRFGR